MHGDTANATALATAVAVSAPAGGAVTVGVAPAFPHLPLVCQAFKHSVAITGGQDCRAEAAGAFTGDVSAAMLRDLGCDFALAGHSERRTHYQETDRTVQQKAAAIIGQGMHAVVCVGETAQQRDAGEYLAIVEKQLRASLPQDFSRDNLSVAYEPVWAIGSGKTASNADIETMHAHICKVLRDIAPDKATPRVLYGGSVKANNALDILSLPVVDGVLVGGASLDADAFRAIIHAAETSAQKR